MGRKATQLIALLLTASITLTSWVPLRDRVDLHGGRFSTKSMSLWELHKYKDTELMRKYPLCYAPFRAYLLVDEHVTIENRNNRNYLIIDTDLYKAIINEARYNRSKAKRYKGTAKQKVRKIYRYCRKTDYEIHVKFASDVFKYRRGDCAAIASAFYVLCKKNKIPVRYVIGWADGECHAWNRVKIQGRWYWIDATLGCWLSREQFPHRSVMEIW
jgi:transglutaminase-like putative cysteine protease